MDTYESLELGPVDDDVEVARAWPNAPYTRLERGAMPPRIRRATRSEALDVVGEVAALYLPAIAIVGTRSLPSRWSGRCARWIRTVVDAAGVAVVSGGAYGVDAMAHRAALDAGVPTVVVLASGILCAGPAKNRPMFSRAARNGGAVISTKRRDARPYRGDFLARNAVIAGLAEAVLVAAAPYGSGAMNTAAHARTLGVPVLAFPGPIDEPAFEGTNYLIRQGARICTGPDDVLRAMGQVPMALPTDTPDDISEPQPATTAPRPAPPPPVLSAAAQQVLEAFGRLREFDAVVAETGLTAASLLVACSELDVALGPDWRGR